MDAGSVNAPLPPGTRLGRYEIVRMLSFGGMGELYLAKSAGIEGFEKEFALKRILAQFASDPSFEHMLLDEARLMASLQHPNIVQVFEIDRVDGFTFFTMEYVHGENLRGVLKAAARQQRGLSRANALFIVMNVAAGLHYAHERKRPDGSPLGLIHRDVCPNNIMLSHDGAVKLVDFGVAMAIARSAKTTPGAIKGNVRYMSPEQSLGERLDRRSDIFSLGIVLFELTTGTRFIREKDDYWAVQKMRTEPLPRPSERRADYPEPLERIVMKALAKNPADRFSTAQELQLALEEFVRETKLPASSVQLARTMTELFAGGASESVQPGQKTPQADELEPAQRTRVTGGRSPWALVGFALLLAALCALGLVLWFRQQSAVGDVPAEAPIQAKPSTAEVAVPVQREPPPRSTAIESATRPVVVPIETDVDDPNPPVPASPSAEKRGKRTPSVAPSAGKPRSSKSGSSEWNLDSPLPPPGDAPP